ncbi:hypothetical protein DYB32_003608 [Aphanomyces invadans]|uniref:WW domain-containing protein n=1 Tax=Aphanomyces invadans TaxID=157072 RepID=A0A418B032_9STRA|nr:hypothetical protein DYB32_003608 [Aphanomyces invadans]
MASPHPPQSHDDVASDWMVCRTDAGDTYYYNIQRQESQWSTPRSLQPLDRPPPLQASIEYEPDCLHVAVSNGDFARVQELLAAGVAVDRLDDDGRTPLWYALEHLDIAVVLLNQSHSKEYIVAQDIFGTTLLHAVTRQRNIEMLTLLLLQVESADEGSSGRIYACDRVDVDARDSHQQTALHVAATFGFRKCVDMLLAHGASPAVLDENSQTPIMLATLGGHVGCVQLLQVALAALLKQTEVAVQAMPVQESTRVHQLQEQVAAMTRALEASAYSLHSIHQPDVGVGNAAGQPTAPGGSRAMSPKHVGGTSPLSTSGLP